ncbi:hypothetical protein, conserved [Angomonas deanei]|uniref:Uncharacterized protein n=1 Tax=Angomonas deanei TaxID=59799 RepID=A0A7G2CHI4_9TRYP|nr:hypothetical protein, conserved [Angomonas deanei]
MLDKWTDRLKSSKVTAEEALQARETQKQEKEKERLAMLIEGAPSEVETGVVRSFLQSNQRHMYADAVCGSAAYVFSALQHVQGQSSALTLLSMWTAGTTFLVSIASRKYAMELVAPTRSTETNEKGEEATTVNNNNSVTTLPLNEAMAIIQEQRPLSFQLETIGSWVWMLAAFQQFKIHKTLKWSGYCSWTGMCCGLYFTLRHLYNNMI